LTDTLQMQITLDKPPQTVYEALTDSGRLAAWFAEHTDVALPDMRYDFWGRHTPETPDREAGRHPILDAVTSTRLQYGWRLSHEDTTVTFTLRPQERRTLLVMQHEGRTYEDFWLLSLSNLYRFLDGKPITRVDYTHPMKGDIHHSIDIDADAATVFDVLIRPEQLNRWIASNATIEPRIGGAYDFGWEGMPPIKIVELTPNEKLAIANPPDPSMPNETVTTWTLEESNGKTRMTLVHSGFADDQDTSGMHTGWLNFMGWVRSIAEYGDDWQPPLKRLAPEMASYYPASIGSRQGELVEI